MKQIIVVEHALFLLGLDIARKEFLPFGRPARALRVGCTNYLFDGHLRVDAARVDREAGPFGCKSAFGFREAFLMPYEFHQVGRVLAVVNREGGIQADLFGALAQQSRADAVIRCRPRSVRPS